MNITRFTKKTDYISIPESIFGYHSLHDFGASVTYQ